MRNHQSFKVRHTILQGKAMPHDQFPARISIEERIVSFDSSEFAQLLGMKVLEAREGYARVMMSPLQKKNPNGVIHGGAVFSLADHAFAIAANAGCTDRVAVSIHIQFIAPAHGDLIAISEIVGDSGRFSTYRIMVYEKDRAVAQCDGVAIRTDS
jgi:acyl-CoA thioesterase